MDKTFTINDKVSIGCSWKKTRMAFKHEAALFINGYQTDFTKICYQNRTWEAYEYQSVIHQLLDKTKALTPEEKALVREYLDGKDGRSGEGCKEDMRGLGAIGMVAKLGEIFCTEKKDQNDWKLRMLKAGLSTSGLSVPEDWDTLTEEEKQRRLDGAIKTLTSEV